MGQVDKKIFGKSLDFSVTGILINATHVVMKGSLPDCLLISLAQSASPSAATDPSNPPKNRSFQFFSPFYVDQIRSQKVSLGDHTAATSR